MLSSITPLGERGRNNNWGLTFSAYVVGSVAGGTAVGATAGALGWMLLRSIDSSARLATAAVACVIALLVELRVGGLRLPTLRRQVNENWLQRYRGWVYGLGFGLQLGAGFATIMTTAAVPLTFVLALLTASPAWAAIVGATFGAARGLMVLPARRVRDQQGLLSLHRRVADTAPTAARATQVTMAVGAAAAVAAALGA